MDTVSDLPDSEWEGLAGSEKRQREILDAFLAKEEELGLITPSTRSLRDVMTMSLALRTHAPRVQVMQEVARRLCSHVQRPPFVEITGTIVGSFWDLEQVFGESHLTERDATRFEWDVAMPYPAGVPKTHSPPVAVLHTDLVSGEFRRFHKFLREKNAQRLTQYVFRPFAASGAAVDRELWERLPRIALQGYGVILDIKNTEYLVIDDKKNASSAASPAASSLPEPQPTQDQLDVAVLAARRPELARAIEGVAASLVGEGEKMAIPKWKVPKLDLQAAALMLASADPLRAGVDLTANLPRRLGPLSRQAVPDSVTLAVAANAQVIPQAMANRVSINGKTMDAEDLSAISLATIVEEDAILAMRLARAGLQEAEVARALAYAQPRGSSSARIDVRHPGVLFVNDLESEDPAYDGWATSVQELVAAAAAGRGMRQVARNLLHLHIFADPGTPEGIEALGYAHSFLAQGAPLRVGVAFAAGGSPASRAAALVFLHVNKKCGGPEAIQALFYASVLRRQNPALTLAEASQEAYHLIKRASPCVERKCSSYDKVVATSNYDDLLARMGKAVDDLGLRAAMPAAVAVNGEIASPGSTNEHAVARMLQVEFARISQLVAAGTISDATKDALEVLMNLPGVYPAYSADLLGSHLKPEYLAFHRPPNATLHDPAGNPPAVSSEGVRAVFLDRARYASAAAEDGGTLSAVVSAVLIADLASPEGARHALHLAQAALKAGRDVRVTFLHHHRALTENMHEETLRFLVPTVPPGWDYVPTVVRAALHAPGVAPEATLRFLVAYLAHVSTSCVEGGLDADPAAARLQALPCLWEPEAVLDLASTSTPGYDRDALRTALVEDTDPTSRGFPDALRDLLIRGVGPATDGPATAAIGVGGSALITNGRLFRLWTRANRRGARARSAGDMGIALGLALSAARPVSDQIARAVAARGAASASVAGLTFEISSLLGARPGTRQGLHLDARVRGPGRAMLLEHRGAGPMLVEAIVDPLTAPAQRLLPLLAYLRNRLNVTLSVLLLPQPDMGTALPLQNLYRFVLDDEPDYDRAGAALAPAAVVHGLPKDGLYTLKLDTPAAWLVDQVDAVHDMDNIRPADHDPSATVRAVYELRRLLVQGYAVNVTNGEPAQGLQLALAWAGSRYDLAVHDTVVMHNLGYFQLQAVPGLFDLRLVAGPAREGSSLVRADGHVTDSIRVVVSDFAGETVSPLLVKARDREAERVEAELEAEITRERQMRRFDPEDAFSNSAEAVASLMLFTKVAEVPADYSPEEKEAFAKAEEARKARGVDGHADGSSSSPPAPSAGSIWESLKTLIPSAEDLLPTSTTSSSSSGEQHTILPDKGDTLHVFSLASGHLYERFLKIMMLSVRERTPGRIKFWFLANFLSPQFREAAPRMAARLGFEVSFVTYQWPRWLRKQTEKQRIIWGYKILFLDVLFPLGVEKVIYVDADQVVRANLRDLWNLDLRGAPYGYTPFCHGDDMNAATKGYRFFDTGYWKDTLRGQHYHISALYVVDLVRFREMLAGDTLRQLYQSLSADPNSLANLDQDLPQVATAAVPIYSLPQEWLFCEAWCDMSLLPRAKTIDLCNNPLTKSPKIETAKRIIPEWTRLDEEAERAGRAPETRE